MTNEEFFDFKVKRRRDLKMVIGHIGATLSTFQCSFSSVTRLCLTSTEKELKLKFRCYPTNVGQVLPASLMSSTFTKSIFHRISTMLQLFLRLASKDSYSEIIFMAGHTWTLWFVVQLNASVGINFTTIKKKYFSNN